ncbi:MAG: thioredoxin fold domain-containing protein [Chitinophagaceae bacterium]|nr:thioredoxin fold domain-containing protein [Chitinophagaceae bacterium]MBL0056192.1 thioredoxin fold domain-containing protein [Chitinophagaceae bacterium]
MIHKLITLIFGFGLIGNTLAQSDSSLLYLRFPQTPPFSIIRVPDSTRFVKADLDKRKATLIMVFSPDCEHCQLETREILAKRNLFKKVQIIMVSPLEYGHLKKFYDEYGISDFQNIILGRDPAYFLGTFYKIRSFPALFLYDKKGNFVRSFDGTVPVEQIAEFL